MPVKYFKCPPGQREDGKKIHTFDYCLNKCKNKCCPAPVLRVMINEFETNHHRGDHISATSVQHCIRQTVLERTTDYAVEPKFSVWQALRGTLIHAMFEESGDPERFLCEVDYKYTFTNADGEEIDIFGRLDMYDKKERTLIDFKTQNDFGYLYTLKNEAAKVDHVWQTNFYRFLLEHGQHCPKDGEENLGNFKVDRIIIIYLSMKSVVETGVLAYEFDNRSGKVKKHDMEEIPLYSPAKVRSYMRPRASILNKGFKTKLKYSQKEWEALSDAEQEELLPSPVKSEDDQGWLCGTRYKQLRGYCGVREHCPFWRDLADKEGIGYGEDSL